VESRWLPSDMENSWEELESLVERHPRIVVGYGSRACLGGLGHAVAATLTTLQEMGASLSAMGPGYAEPWSLPGGVPESVKWSESPDLRPSSIARRLWLRWRVGRLVLLHDQRLGAWIANRMAPSSTDMLYTFTQIGLESIQRAHEFGIPVVLENPNGHVRNFQDVYAREASRLFGIRYTGHPHRRMVERVEEEYRLADKIRVYSEWAKNNLMEFGIPADKVWVLPHPIDITRFHPTSSRPPAEGPLRLCFVGSLCLRKGFWYLLRAMRLLGPQATSLEIVGATGGRHSARLFEEERRGLHVTDAPGDPRGAYQQAEVFVAPTLEDGFGFVVAEAMASGLPVIVTDACGAKDWVVPGRSGWIVPAGDVEALASAIEEAYAARPVLAEMGRFARQDVLERVEECSRSRKKVG
jgi:glycosyltransferase involved in cell wall biosynthesis